MEETTGEEVFPHKRQFLCFPASETRNRVDLQDRPKVYAQTFISMVIAIVP